MGSSASKPQLNASTDAAATASTTTSQATRRNHDQQQLHREADVTQPSSIPPSPAHAATNAVQSSCASVTATPVPALSSPLSSADASASASGGVARALSSATSTLSRLGATLYRVPVKSFRQNKIAFEEGHVTEHIIRAHHAHSHELSHGHSGPSIKRRGKRVSPLRWLAAQQGYRTLFFSQLLPSLTANVGLGILTFTTFDLVIAGMNQLATSNNGILPEWMASRGLSTCEDAGDDLSSGHHHSRCSLTPFLSPRIGPDVLLAGMAAGVAQCCIATPIENAASLMKAQYAQLIASSTTTTTSHPRSLANINLLASLRALSPFRSSTSTYVLPSSSSGPSSLFSHFSFRMVRDGLSLGVFFFVFESIYARLRIMPYAWMEMMLEHAHEHGRETSSATSITHKYRIWQHLPPPVDANFPSHSCNAPFVPPVLLGSLLGWQCFSVLSGGMLAGVACHWMTQPFDRFLARLHHGEINTGTSHTAGRSASTSAWKALRDVHRLHGWRGILSVLSSRGSATSAAVFSSSSAPRRLHLLNPLVLGLVVYTLTKVEHQTRQLQMWRQYRAEQRKLKHEGKHV